ncbi:hypothetical protein ACHQM5_013788 [Ranunculus cassubicifolius]
MVGEGDEDGYDAVVVGSGYGGSVAACRMSMAGIKVCLMEKGRKWEAQDFPTNSFNILSAYRVENKVWGFSFGPKDALIQMFEQDDSVAAIACGLGGGSLINAGVMVSTPVRARRNKKWPKEWDSDWEVCEASAAAMLGIQSSPLEFPSSRVTRQIIEEEIEDCIPNSIKLSINFGSKESSTNSIGTRQTSSCLACGNCLSGCPYDAKNSTDKNYLAAAMKAGCTIKTGCQVQYVVRNLDECFADIDKSHKRLRRRWRVYLSATDYTLCDFVIISAGVLGTAEILFQSARRGLKVSERLGYGFSTNGNNCAYLGLSSAPLSSYGLEKDQFLRTPFGDRPGPSISSSYTSSLGFSIQPAVLPLSFPYLLFKGIVTYGWPSGYSLFHGIIEKLNHMLGLKSSQAMILNVMGYDDSDGRITLEKDSDKICFTPPHDPLLPKKIQALQKITKRLGGILFMSRKRSTSVHLLGGCNAALDPSQGVCDPNGRVFTSESSTTVHPGLYVCDASLIPCSVGMNPCLTIATAAEHVSRYLVQDSLTYKAHISSLIQGTSFVEKTSDPKSKGVGNEKIPTVLINETMRGHIGGMPCTAYLTMKMNSRVQKGCHKQITSIGEPHPFLRGKVGGYVIFKSVEKDKLYIIDGEVDMCKVDNRTPYTQYMHYYLILASGSGSRYVLEGRKIMNPFVLFSYAWWESRTLHVTIRTLGQRNTEQKIDLTGELSLCLGDLLQSVIGLEGNAKGRFLCLLLQSFFRTYVLQTPRVNHHNFSQTDLKDKPYPPSIYHEIITEDGVFISCRQWKCKQDPWKNEKKKSLPVLLINGYSTESYSLPTEPNDLVRTLLESEHETWLLQPRLHPLHPSNKFTLEDVAKFDIPAALKKICELHDPCAKVHVVAHCVGGLAIHIALMGGHVSANHIASLSCTNSSMFFKLTTSSMVKMSLPIIPSISQTTETRSQDDSSLREMHL